MLSHKSWGIKALAMRDKKPEDFQLWSIFIILAVLTVCAVFIAKMVLFAPPLLLENAIK